MKIQETYRVSRCTAASSRSLETHAARCTPRDCKVHRVESERVERRKWKLSCQLCCAGSSILRETWNKSRRFRLIDLPSLCLRPVAQVKRNMCVRSCVRARSLSHGPLPMPTWTPATQSGMRRLENNNGPAASSCAAHGAKISTQTHTGFSHKTDQTTWKAETSLYQ